MTPLPVRDRRIDSIMSPLPLAVDADAELAVAERILRENRIGHVVVKRGGDTVGLLSAAELALLERVGGRWRAGAVAAEPVFVPRDATIGTLVERMREKRLGAVLVRSQGEVVGIVTMTDLLRLLGSALGLGSGFAAPSAVRDRILSEHLRIRSLLDDLEELARTVVVGGDEVGMRLRKWVRELGAVLHEHLALEEDVLLPLVRESDGFGDARAEEMLREHAEQREMIENILEELTATRSNEVLSVGVLELVRAVRDDIEEEERMFLREDALPDTVVSDDASGG